MGIQNFLAKARALREDKSGNVAMIAALSIIPIITVAGFAVDFQIVSTKKIQVQYALDSAVIAGARAMQNGESQDNITLTVQNYIEAMAGIEGANMSCNTASVTFSEENEDITAAVLCTQPTTLSAVFGKTEIDFNVGSTSSYGVGKLDVVFIFDSSGSMSGSRLSSLKDASALAVQELLPEGSEDIRIAMVAYNDMVNSGDYFEDVVEDVTYTETEWEDESYWATSYENDDCWYWGWWRGTQYWYCEVWTEETTEEEYDHTCVYEREDDEAFTLATPGDDAWLEVTGHDWWDDDCPPSEPLPLTDNKDVLLEYIDDLTADGGTAGHQGVAWGGYLLSPEWSDIWPEDSAPLAYDEPDSSKALILMTDGNFNSYNASGQGNSQSQAEDLCDAIKDEGILIYAVAFQAPSSGEAIMEYCASGAEFYFDPADGDELEDDYRAIATSISDLRIKS
ncbi:MAG: VWA domain-containing protein [Hyphomonadaceae bacterium]